MCRKPIDVEQLALSSFGAWLKSEGKWEVRPDGVDLKEWVHLATMGRDHFVRLVDAGRLWGIGHRVDLIKIIAAAHGDGRRQADRGAAAVVPADPP